MGSLLYLYIYSPESTTRNDTGEERGVGVASQLPSHRHLAISPPLGTWDEHLHFGTNRTNGTSMHVPLVPLFVLGTA